MKRLTIEEVRKVGFEHGYILLDDEYINYISPLNWTDSYGYKYYASFGSMLHGLRAVSKQNPYSIENIEKYIEINNRTDTLLSEKYTSNGSKDKNDKLCFKCKNGHIFYQTWNDYQSFKGCARCVRSYDDKDSFLEVLSDMYGDEYVLLEEYKGSQVKVKFKHNKCGNIFCTKPNSLTQGHGCPNNECCHARGEKHYRWNPLLTEEDRKRNASRLTMPKYKDWRNNVFKRDGYKCVICGYKKIKNKIIPHHLNSWDKYIDERFDVNNGVTLCENHHIDFHKAYGYGNNTKEQFDEYLNNQDNTEVSNQIA